MCLIDKQLTFVPKMPQSSLFTCGEEGWGGRVAGKGEAISSRMYRHWCSLMGGKMKVIEMMGKKEKKKKDRVG